MNRREFLALGLVASAVPVDGAGAAPSPGAGNVMQLRDVGGNGTRNHPLRIARPFSEGVIKGAPQALVDGVPVPTQADVKTRWPDGTVRHAILSLIVPRLPAGGTVVIRFREQEGGNAVPLTPAQMLDPAFDFGAVMEIMRDGRTEAASARSMLRAGDFSLWCAGPIATTLILADHSAVRRYDIGLDPLRPVRPIFHATFWPQLRKVHVRVIGENSNTEALKDVAYDLTLRAGLRTPTPIFAQRDVRHYAGTRWTRSFWLGGPPSATIDIDHGLAYLAATRALPNYDPGLSVPEQEIARAYARWRATSHAIGEPGGWVKYMPTTGGRNDIGPHAETVTRWLYTGDHRDFEIVSGMADLAGAWPLQVREGNPAKRLDRARSVPGIGHPISPYDRPSLWLFDGCDRSRPEDRVPIHDPRLADATGRLYGGWHPDAAHQPDPFSALYLLTGDAFALEQTQLWAAFDACATNPGYKGPLGSGVIRHQVRGCAWVLRNRVNAAVLSPDATPEKALFGSLISDAIGYWEGMHDIRGTRHTGDPFWRYGQTQAPRSPLHFFADNFEVRAGSGLRSEMVSSDAGMWQQYFLIVEFGRAREQGFPTAPLLAWTGQMLLSQFADPTRYPPANVARYWSPMRKRDRTFYATWPETLGAYQDPSPPRFKGFDCDSYWAYAYAASTMLTAEPGGTAAYEWLRRTVYVPTRSHYATCPKKWALLPHA